MKREFKDLTVEEQVKYIAYFLKHETSIGWDEQ
jgi:hypothetical protein